MTDHVLLLARHAQAERYLSGVPDDSRPLTEQGQHQAAELGAFLRDTAIDYVVCSPTTRTRQTLAALDLNVAVDFSAELYQAGSDTILAEVRQLAEAVRTVLVVGHAPGVPALAHDLSDPDGSDPDALRRLAEGYPPATLTRLELDGTWVDLAAASARLTGIRVAR